MIGLKIFGNSKKRRKTLREVGDLLLFLCFNGFLRMVFAVFSSLVLANTDIGIYGVYGNGKTTFEKAAKLEHNFKPVNT